MRCSILAASLVVLALGVVQPVAAQVPGLRRGARVRVTVRSAAVKPFVGVVDSVTDGAFWVHTGTDVRSGIAIAQLTRLELSRGQTRPTWSKTAPIWLTLSAGGLGALVASATDSQDDMLGPDFAAGAGGVFFGGIGLLVGTGLALGVKHDTWETVIDRSSPARTSVVPSIFVAPASHRLTLGLRAAF